jgi:cell division protein FtsW
MRKTSTILITAVLLLLSIGIVILASTSSVRGSQAFHDPHYFLKRQAFWLLVALCVAVVLVRLDYHGLRRLAVPVVAIAVTLLILVLVPGIGSRVGGSRRWLRFGPVGFQPSEYAKLALVIGVAAWMDHVGRRARTFKEGILRPMALVGGFALLMMLEPDFGTTIVSGLVGLAIVYAGGARLGHIAVTGMAGACALALAIMQDPVRMGRVMAFLRPEGYPYVAHHLAQSKIAFIRGGLSGVGLSNSLQKELYLPEAHTDFIFAIVGEELGFAATAGVVLLFCVILVCGMFISYRAPDPFGRLLGFGLTMLITLQAAINVGVVTGCLPTKGLALPFVSYGGSSLVTSVAAISILLNIAWHGHRETRDAHTVPIKDRQHWF